MQTFVSELKTTYFQTLIMDIRGKTVSYATLKNKLYIKGKGKGKGSNSAQLRIYFKRNKNIS